MFDFSLCKSESCPEKFNCMRFLVEDRHCHNPVKVHLGNHLCTSKNNYFLKIYSTCDIPTKGGESINGNGKNNNL